MKEKEICGVIDGYDVISFDVFDTLLVRPFVQPRDLWRYIEKYHNLEGFCRHRSMCDTGKHYSIYDQYSMMPERLRHAIDIEINIETGFSVANEKMKRVFQYARNSGKTVIVSSDMYLTKDIISEMLNRNGISGWDRMYVSSSDKMEKSDGTMFCAIRKDFGKQKVLHIGDNPRSDVESPGRYGIDSVAVENVCGRFFDENPFARKFIESYDQIETNAMTALLAIASYNYEALSGDDSYFSRLNSFFGTLISVSYLQFVSKYVKQNDIGCVIFIARDGYILKGIFDILFPDVETLYVYASRAFNTNSDTDEYKKYINSLGIRDNSVIVDLSTIKFTAYRLISGAYGKKISQLSFMSTENLDDRRSFIQVKQDFAYLFNLLEIMFRAPEHPIICIKDCKPVYQRDISKYEQFSVDNAERFLTIQKYCAVFVYDMLQKMQIELDPVSVLQFIISFVFNLTNKDKAELLNIRQGVDYGHSDYRLILPAELFKNK